MKKYLITGFSGFVSYHFLVHLNNLNEKIKVLGLDISEPMDIEKWSFNNLDISFKKANILDKDEVFETIKEFTPDYILHLAALSSVGKSWEEPELCFLNNTGIFLNIVEAVRKQQIKCKILCIGSSEEYGYVGSDQIPISEQININPSSPYAVTKVAQEGLSKCYVAKYHMDINLTRSFNHIGPRQKDAFVIASFCKQIAQAYVSGQKELKMVTGNLNVIRDFLDVRDVVVAYDLILKHGKPGEIYNVCSGQGYALDDVIKLLEEISGLNIETSINPEYLRPNDMPIIIGDNKKIIDDTGWKPIYTIKQSLTDIFNYWVEYLKK